MTEQVQENTSAQPAQENQSTDLTINDLGALKAIIDLASTRGAFKPNEMVAVGQTYAKLDTFLQTVAKQAEAAKAANAQAQAPAQGA